MTRDTHIRILAWSAAGVATLACLGMILLLAGCTPRDEQPAATPPASAAGVRTLTLSWDPYDAQPGFDAIRVYRGEDACDETVSALPPLLLEAEPVAIRVAADGSLAHEYVDDTVPNVDGMMICYELDAVNTDGTPSPRSGRAAKVLG